jgi:branched-chain amino acid aminotransferase
MTEAYLGWAASAWHGIWQDNHWVQIDSPPLIHPASASVQFGQSVIEGMKAHLNPTDGIVRAFRLHDHWKRLVDSCNKLKLPIIPESLFRDALGSILLHKSQWQQPLSSNTMYIRPIVYSLDDHIFPKHGKRFGLSIYVAPVGNFLVKNNYILRIQDQIGRAADNGLGSTKTASNYAPIFAAQHQQCNVHNLLWLTADVEPVIDEANTSNIFFITKQNRLITPSLNDRILPGITRKSIIQLAEEFKIPIEEKSIELQNLRQNLCAGDIIGCFLTSTGCGIQPVHTLSYKQQTWMLMNHPLMAKLEQAYINCFYGSSEFFREWAELLGCIEETK